MNRCPFKSIYSQLIAVTMVMIMMMVDHVYHENLTPESMVALLDALD